MLRSVLGTKVGMTQVFDENRVVVPVTVINIGNWFVTQIKTSQDDGYTALQVALPRKRYRGMPFASEWLKKKKNYFLHVREVELADEGKVDEFKVGQSIAFGNSALELGDVVRVAGVSKGKGFQGVMRRWGFAGGPKSHGSTFHRKPGSIGMHASQGKVIKGKKLPGHHGAQKITVEGLKIVKFDDASQCLFVKGAVPGKKDSLVSVSKRG